MRENGIATPTKSVAEMLNIRAITQYTDKVPQKSSFILIDYIFTQVFQIQNPRPSAQNHLFFKKTMV